MGGHKNQPIHFIDFSSELWFGDFINTAWGPYGYSDTLLSSKYKILLMKMINIYGLVIILHLLPQQLITIKFFGGLKLVNPLKSNQ